MRRTFPVLVAAIIAFGVGAGLKAGASLLFPHGYSNIFGSKNDGASAALAPTPAITIPLSLSQSVSGTELSSAGWTNAGFVTLKVETPPTIAHLMAEVEMRPISESLQGVPTVSEVVMHNRAIFPLPILRDGRYRWQVRLSNASGTSAWTTYNGGAVAFGVYRSVVPAPAISSPSDPEPASTYATSTLVFHMARPHDAVGIVGYGYRLDHARDSVPPTRVRTSSDTVSLSGLPTGTYYYHVRAVDAAGNWSQTSTFPVHVDVTPPSIKQAVWAQFYFDPDLEKLHLSYELSKTSQVTFGVYDANGVRIRHLTVSGWSRANTVRDMAWNGRDDRGHTVPEGSYSIYLRATDRLGNVLVKGYAGLSVTYKKILVSLARQEMWAYDGTRQVLHSLVTTGNKVMPTPTGVYHVMFARSPFTFHSPWPKGSPYYYAPSPVNYALYFADSGYFIHDAPWRSVFGPGSNAMTGTPGQNLTGTHGCVNVPESTMAQLYSWAPPGTTVQIVAN